MKISLFAPLTIITVILGLVIIKHFDFDSLTFEDPWLDTLYTVTFILLIFFMFRNKILTK